MDAIGVDMQLLSIAPPQYFYQADADLGAELARIQNDRIAEIAASNPQRFLAMGTLPLQAPAEAQAELCRIVDDFGVRGLQINTNVQGRDLDHPDIGWLWHEAERRRLLVIMHPHGFSSAERLWDHYLTNAIGLPLESCIALSRLILSGVLERHPRLRLLVARWRVSAVLRGQKRSRVAAAARGRRHIARPPSSYLRMVHFDTTTHSPEAVPSSEGAP